MTILVVTDGLFWHSLGTIQKIATILKRKLKSQEIMVKWWYSSTRSHNWHYVEVTCLIRASASLPPSKRTSSMHSVEN